jgi:hypothetical protein
MYRQGFY